MKFVNAATRVLLLLPAITLFLAGCGGNAELTQPKELTQLPAPAYRMETLWRTDGGDGAGTLQAGFKPTVANGRVFVANSDGTVMAIDLKTGHPIWRAHTGNALVAGPSAGHGKLLLGTRNGRVVALSSQTGKRQWSVKLSSAVLSAPAVGAKKVVARTLDGRLVALSLKNGKRRWTLESSVPKLTMHGTSSPRIAGQTVYAGMDNGNLLAVDLATGDQRWKQRVALPTGRSELDRIVDIDANPVVASDRVFAISAGDKLVAMSRDSGRILWRQDVASVSGLAIGKSSVYTSDLDSVVWSVDKNTGDRNWHRSDLEYRKLSAPAIYEGDVLVGDYQGYVHWLSSDDGSEIARGRPFDEAIQAKPVVAGNRVIVLGADGEVAAVRFRPAKH